MSIKSTGNIHINHQICLSSDNNLDSKKHKRFNLSKNEFDSFNPELKEYLSKTNTRQSRDDVIDWIKRESPIAAITMVFNCAINHSQSINLLNRFYDHLCKYQFGRTYKKRRELIMMFAFLENAVIDKSKQSHLRHENANHFHLILCDRNGIFENFNMIRTDIESAMRQANSDFKKAFKANNPNASFTPQIARCKVQDYFNYGNDNLENYVTKNLEKYSRDHDLKFDQIGYPSIDGFTFGERIYQ